MLMIWEYFKENNLAISAMQHSVSAFAQSLFWIHITGHKDKKHFHYVITTQSLLLFFLFLMTPLSINKKKC